MNKKEITYTYVWSVNKHMVVARSIKQAIDIYCVQFDAMEEDIQSIDRMGQLRRRSSPHCGPSERGGTAMKTIYISLPITGYDLEERRATARHQREKLMAQGWCVVDPLNQQANIPDEASWQDHMRYDLKLLLSCDAIYMMDGWHTSRGCTTEYLVASDCGLEILGTICTDVHPYVVSTQSLRELPDDTTIAEEAQP